MVRYADAKLQYADEIIRDYGRKEEHKTGMPSSINKYLDKFIDRKIVLEKSTIPKLYRQWNEDGSEQIPGLMEIVEFALRHYDNNEKLEKANPEEIIEFIKTEMKNKNIYMATATRASEEIKKPILDFKFNIESRLGMDYRNTRLLANGSNGLKDDFSYEMQTLLDSIRDEEIAEYLDDDAKQKLNEMERAIEEYQMQRKQNNIRQKDKGENSGDNILMSEEAKEDFLRKLQDIADSIPNGTNTSDQRKSNAEQGNIGRKEEENFRESLKVDVPPLDGGKKSTEDKDVQKDNGDKVETLESDRII